MFFSTIAAYLITGLFLLINSLVLWSEISTFNILDNSYASMNSFFTISPLIFLLFIPAVSMRIFSEEYKHGTIETLLTKPLSVYQIVMAKFLAVFTLICIAILPTTVYVVSIYFLGEQIGNLDLAGIIGSYIGLILLGGVFSSISIYSSSKSSNQIVAFILGILLSSVFYFGFDLLSNISFLSNFEYIIQKAGISHHYYSMSKGLLKLSDIIYFISISFLFIKLTETSINKKRT